MNTVLNVGIIGAGRIAKVHAATLAYRIPSARTLAIADVNLANNSWPARPAKSRFQLFKQERPRNPMQQLERKPAGQ